MQRTTPCVRQQLLWLSSDPTPLCQVGSLAWFTWLATATAFRFQSSRRLVLVYGHGPPLAPIALRKEQRRNGHYWYAYRRAHRQLYKRYAGRSDQLTLARLEAVADSLQFF